LVKWDFTNEATVMSEFKPLMLEVASNNEETVEISEPAMLVLSDNHAVCGCSYAVLRG
jgi:hypothetical protein